MRLLTNPALVLVTIANNPMIRLTTIADRLGIQVRTVSVILRDMREAGIVQSKRVGRGTVYVVDKTVVDELLPITVGQLAELARR